MAKNGRLHVRLGETGWSKHTYPRSGVEAGLTLLGSVYKGQQHGALAQKNDGAYVMLVGDYEMPLNQHLIRAALNNCHKTPPPEVTTPPQTCTKAPVVIVKKRRVIMAPA